MLVAVVIIGCLLLVGLAVVIGHEVDLRALARGWSRLADARRDVGLQSRQLSAWADELTRRERWIALREEALDRREDELRRREGS